MSFLCYASAECAMALCLCMSVKPLNIGMEQAGFLYTGCPLLVHCVAKEFCYLQKQRDFPLDVCPELCTSSTITSVVNLFNRRDD